MIRRIRFVLFVPSCLSRLALDLSSYGSHWHHEETSCCGMPVHSLMEREVKGQGTGAVNLSIFLGWRLKLPSSQALGRRRQAILLGEEGTGKGEGCSLPVLFLPSSRSSNSVREARNGKQGRRLGA
jgi:hypothetical protein